MKCYPSDGDTIPYNMTDTPLEQLICNRPTSKFHNVKQVRISTMFAQPSRRTHGTCCNKHERMASP